MELNINQLSDMKEFAKYLSKKLEKLGYSEESKMVYEFSYNSYTTSSEYLGELKFILEDLKKDNIISDEEIKVEIDVAIKVIIEAFARVGTVFPDR